MLVIVRDFSQQVGPTFLPFRAGEVIENRGLELELLRSKAPVVEVRDRIDLIQCPHCRRKFTVGQAVDSEDSEE